MNWHTILSCILIFLGASIMLFSIVKLFKLFDVLPLIQDQYRNFISRFLKFHLSLMFFFFAGYIIVAISYLLKLGFIDELFVGSIFFLGAVFVLIGITLQSKMCSGLQSTMYSLLPICANCKNIRFKSGPSEEQKSWVPLEIYLSQKVNIELSHGLCPACLKKLYPDLEE